MILSCYLLFTIDCPCLKFPVLKIMGIEFFTTIFLTQPYLTEREQMLRPMELLFSTKMFLVCWNIPMPNAIFWNSKLLAILRHELSNWLSLMSHCFITYDKNVNISYHEICQLVNNALIRDKVPALLWHFCDETFRFFPW